MKRPAGSFPSAVAAFLLLAGCSSEPEETVIARVGDSALTLEAAKSAVDTAAADYPQRLSRYVGSWVNSELLHQEALRLGIEGDAAFEARVASVRRQLANQELLDRLVYGDSAKFDEGTLRAYLAAHPDEFTIAENYAKLRHATFRGRETARKFAQAVSAGKDWNALLDSIAGKSAAPGEIALSAPERWYTRSTIFPPELWKVAGTLSPGEVSFPLKTAEGYTVLQYLAAAPAGKTTEFEVVREEVLNRMLVEERRARLDSLLGTLRERYGVEVNMNNAGSAPRQ